MSKTKALSELNERGISLDKYAGRWVALIDQRVVAFDKTLEGLMIKVKKMGLEEKVSVFLVPRKDEGPYVLIISHEKNLPLSQEKESIFPDN